MASDSRSERLKAIEEMDLPSQQKEMMKILTEIVKVVERLELKIGELK